MEVGCDLDKARAPKAERNSGRVPPHNVHGGPEETDAVVG